MNLLGALLLSSLFLNPLNSDPTLGNCEVFPTNNIWNTPVDTLPLHPFSESYVRSIGAQKKLKDGFRLWALGGNANWNSIYTNVWCQSCPSIF